MCQLEISWDVVHRKEPTEEGQAYINSNRDRLNVTCWELLKMMLDGRRFNHPECTESKLTLSLSSRMSELKNSSYKVSVSKEWIIKDGKKLYKEYFLSSEEIDRVKNLIIKGLEFNKKDRNWF